MRRIKARAKGVLLSAVQRRLAAAFGRRYSMSMILQLPGSLLPGKPSPEGMFFFFGCVTHPEEIKTDAQFY